MDHNESGWRKRGILRSSGHNEPSEWLLHRWPHSGTYYAVTDQAGPGTQALIQAFTVPGPSPAVRLSFSMFVNDYDSGPQVNAAGLDYTAVPNQHARVDIPDRGRNCS